MLLLFNNIFRIYFFNNNKIIKIKITKATLIVNKKIKKKN